MPDRDGPAGDGADEEDSPDVFEVDTLIEAPGWDAVADVERVLHRALAAAHSAEARDARPACVSVLLTDDAVQRRLNRDFRGKDAATNVLSFPAAAGPLGAGPRLLGDLVFAFETVDREARAEGKPLADHLAHLAVHGLLHLHGHDHDHPATAERMEAAERRILAGLGIPDPYRDTEPS